MQLCGLHALFITQNRLLRYDIFCDGLDRFSFRHTPIKNFPVLLIISSTSQHVKCTSKTIPTANLLTGAKHRAFSINHLADANKT